VLLAVLKLILINTLECALIVGNVLYSMEEAGGKSVQITGARRSGRGPDCVAYVFVFLGSIVICRLFKLTLSHQAQGTLQLTVNLCGLVYKDF
jgi:hypothetical protein